MVVLKMYPIALIAVIIMGCASGASDIRIENAKASLSPMMMGVGSVFMNIVNAGTGKDTLLNARVDIPGTIVEMHDVKDGRMAKTEAIKIPSLGTVELKPGGLHIMIFKMPDTVKAGSEMELTLVFKQSGEKAFKVRFGASENHTSSQHH